FLPLLLAKKNRKNIDIVAQGRMLPSTREFLSMLATFSLTVLAWVFFRADSVGHAMSYIGGIFSMSIFSLPELSQKSYLVLLLILLFVLIEWSGREQQFAIQKFAVKMPRVARWSFYYLVV